MIDVFHSPINSSVTEILSLFFSSFDILNNYGGHMNCENQRQKLISSQHIRGEMLSIHLCLLYIYPIRGDPEIWVKVRHLFLILHFSCLLLRRCNFFWYFCAEIVPGIILLSNLRQISITSSTVNILPTCITTMEKTDYDKNKIAQNWTDNVNMDSCIVLHSFHIP